jgi:MFS family permease
MWYKRSEAQRRYSFFFSSTTLAGAFGGLLASAIGKMDGLRGYHGWRWIFILEGVLTCVVAGSFFFLIPSFPEDAKWPTPEERSYIKARLQADQGRSAAERKISIRDVGRVFKDYKVILVSPKFSEQYSLLCINSRVSSNVQQPVEHPKCHTASGTFYSRMSP